MPGMDGRALAKALAPMQPDMKVIYMSGYTGFTLSGLDDSEIILLPKPFTKQTLLQRVHEVLELEMKLDAK